jgi:hypothetical protein
MRKMNFVPEDCPRRREVVPDAKCRISPYIAALRSRTERRKHTRTSGFYPVITIDIILAVTGYSF